MLYVVRHGETDWNREHKIQGINDTILNESGIAQAHQIAKKLHAVQFKRIYASSLSRAYITAEIISSHNEYFKGRPIKDVRLRERTFGAYEGMKIRDIALQFEKLYTQPLPNFDPSFDWFGDPEVETIESVATRSMSALDEMAGEGDVPVCAVTHGGVMKVVIDTVLGIPYTSLRRYDIPNCAVLVLKKKKKIWFMSSFFGIDD